MKKKYFSQELLTVGHWYVFEKYGVGQFDGVLPVTYTDPKTHTTHVIDDLYQFSFPSIHSIISFRADRKTFYRPIASPAALRQALVIFEHPNYTARNSQWRTIVKQYDKILSECHLGRIIGLAIDAKKRIDAIAIKKNKNKTTLPTGFHFYFEKAIEIIAQEWSVVFNVPEKHALKKVRSSF